jgi:predicted regulator of Ras-like GTPase activity (Roadblock/LC7/MglB family)
MKRADVDQLRTQIQEPMRWFVREARVRTAVLVNRSGQVLAQHGFTSSYDVANVAALAAATHSSAHALAQLTGSGRWIHLHHAGHRRQLFLAPFRTPTEELILVTIFDDESTLGLVQLFFDRFSEMIGAIPAFQEALNLSDAESFEADLEAGIERLLSDPPEG